MMDDMMRKKTGYDLRENRHDGHEVRGQDTTEGMAGKTRHDSGETWRKTGRV